MTVIDKTTVLAMALALLLGLAWHEKSAAQDREQTVGPVSEENSPAVCRNGFALAGIACQGPYCDNKTLICRSYTRIDRSAAYQWSDWFSEEGADGGRNQVEASSGFVTGIGCSGAYCDNLRLQLLVESGTLSNSGDCNWRPRAFSEEPNPRSEDACPSGQFVAGIRCTGGYCDNLRLLCCRAIRR